MTIWLVGALSKSKQVEAGAGESGPVFMVCPKCHLRSFRASCHPSFDCSRGRSSPSRTNPFDRDFQAINHGCSLQGPEKIMGGHCFLRGFVGSDNSDSNPAVDRKSARNSGRIDEGKVNSPSVALSQPERLAGQKAKLGSPRDFCRSPETSPRTLSTFTKSSCCLTTLIASKGL